MTIDAVETADEALMLAYADGDAGAFTRLYDRHERPVLRFFLRQGVAPSQADDLLQETWMAIVRNAATYAVDAKFMTWLYTIARRKLIDHWRATRQTILLDDAANDPDLDDDGPSAVDRIAAADSVRPDVRAMSRQQAVALVAAVEALPAAQREAFLLHVEGDLTMAERADVAHVTVETQKSRLRYAMKRLRVACAAWLEPTPVLAARASSGAFDEA